MKLIEYKYQNNQLVNVIETDDGIAPPPDWHKLEQELRYANDSALFGKAFTTATDKGLNLFMTTLVNGKLGHSSEAALTFAFSYLGVTWTDEEKITINTLLTQNNFTIQI